MRQYLASGVMTCALAALAACGAASFFGIEARVALLGPELDGSGQLLAYEDVAAKQARIQAELDAATEDPDAVRDFLLQLHPGAFARIAHLSDAQIREQRAVLIGSGVTDIINFVSDYVAAGEGSQRGSLQEADSPFTWAAVCQTVNWIHGHVSGNYAIDCAVHTGDAVDVGLRSELAHFVFGAYELDVPLLVAAGNHDISTFGLWREGFTFQGLTLDTTFDFEGVDPDVVAGNEESLIQGRTNFAAQFRDLVDKHPDRVHLPTFAATNSAYFGLDTDLLYSTYEIRPPVPGIDLPGLQVIVLETNIDDGSFEAEMDPEQLAWLNGVLDDARTRQNLVIVTAHHPPIEVKRADKNRGVIERASVPPAMAEVRAMCSHYPNVILFLCGHTHKPQVCEWRSGFTDTSIAHDAGPDDGALEWIQIDAGSILVSPQESGIVELVFDDDDVIVHNSRFGPLQDPASDLGARTRRARESARNDDQSAPRYLPDRSYVGVLRNRLQVFRNVPFGVNVPAYDLAPGVAR